MTERAKFKAVVNLIIKQDDKFLLYFRNDGFFAYDGGWWALPAGHIEQGETPAQAAVREAKEEMDIDILLKDLEFVNVMSNLANQTEGFDFFFIVHKYLGTIRNCEGDKCVMMKYFSFDEIDKMTHVITATRIAMKAVKNGIKYSEHTTRINSN